MIDDVISTEGKLLMLPQKVKSATSCFFCWNFEKELIVPNKLRLKNAFETLSLVDLVDFAQPQVGAENITFPEM